MKKNKGFTLAEVLITLGIIGVVAAMTLPNLINDSRNKELESRFKKTYAYIDNTLNLAFSQEEEALYEFNNQYPKTASINSAMDKILSYFSKNKTTDCSALSTYKYYSGYRDNPTMSNSYPAYTGCKFYELPDGALVWPQKAYYSGGYSILWIYFDSNGYKKGPNIGGQDIFVVTYNPSSGKLLPGAGTNIDSAIQQWNGNWDATGTLYAFTYPDYFKNIRKPFQ